MLAEHAAVPLFKITPNNNMVASIIGATVGAIILIFLMRKFIKTA
ncbi:MAG: GlsB/YeaQ/YmgE family stress response membrane protein [Armatimonadetes bacterium]|nr:GlsB/YeaQ/YmgE family stress response membrane protein [Armatimonadota bacterium]